MELAGFLVYTYVTHSPPTGFMPSVKDDSFPP